MCDHVGRVVAWGCDSKANLVVKLWGCTRCDVVSSSMLEYDSNFSVHEHVEYVDGCFACKMHTLQLNTGDAAGGRVASGWTQKKWDKELQLYRDARAQGVQPSGTSTAKIQAALDISDKTGRAYDASRKGL